MSVEFHVLDPKEDQGLLRAICGDNGAQAAIISLETREWQIFPWVDTASMKPG
jgi:hypothetical protein